jgi:hypothetical protein
MQFTLWGKNQKAIMRIYIEGTDAFIWRKSKNKPLEIQEDGYLPKEAIHQFLLVYGINIKTIATRRQLAQTLFENNLLTGNISPYMHFFHNPHDSALYEPTPPRTQSAPMTPSTKGAIGSRGNVVSFMDFKNRRS